MPPDLTQREYERTLIQHVVYMERIGNLAVKTIEGRMAAVTRAHLEECIILDRSQMPLLSLTIRGLKRLSGGCRRKLAVTIDILFKMREALDLNKWEDLNLWNATLTGFFFLLRSVEYLDVQTEANDKMRLRVAHFQLRAAGKDLDLAGGPSKGAPNPDEMLIILPYSKTDMEGQGRELNLFAEDDNELCVVTSMADAWRMNPKHFQRPEAPLFSNKEGRPVKKTDLQEALRKASAELGYNPEDYSSHSLRSGGATAMYEADIPVEDIQRRGRWKSSCWRIHIFGDRK